MKLKRPTTDDSIEHMKRDFAFDFENQTKFLTCTEVEIGWGSGDVILFIININNIFPARTVLKAVKKHCTPLHAYFRQGERCSARLQFCSGKGLDNGSEFVNDEYRDTSMCEAFNITVAKKQQETTTLIKRKFYRKLQPIHNRRTPMNKMMTQITKNKNCQLKKTFLIVKLAIKMTPQMKTVKLLL